MDAKSRLRDVLIAVGLAVLGIGMSRLTLSGADQHDEVPVVCTLVIDAGVAAWLLLTFEDWRASRRDH